MSVSKKNLEKAVKELNDKIVEPPIKMGSEAEMVSEILEASVLIEDDDGITDDTMITITILKEQGGGKAEPKKEVKSKPKKEVKSKPKKEVKSKKDTKKEVENKSVSKPKKEIKKKETYTRLDSIMSIIEKIGKKGSTSSQIIENAHVLYVNKTGIGNIKEIKPSDNAKAILKGLVYFNVLSFDSGIYSFIK